MYIVVVVVVVVVESLAVRCRRRAKVCSSDLRRLFLMRKKWAGENGGELSKCKQLSFLVLDTSNDAHVTTLESNITTSQLST